MALVRTARGTGNSTAAATSIAMGPTSDYARGSLAVLYVAYDNNGANGADPYSSFTDAQGNFWQTSARLQDPGVAAAGLVIRVFWAYMDHPLTSAETVSLSFGAVSVTAKAWTFDEVKSTLAFGRAVAGTPAVGSSAGTAFTGTSASLAVGDLLLAGMGLEANSNGSDDADATNGTWTTGQADIANTGTTATSMGIRSQTKLQTTTPSTQTWNFTVANTDWAYLFLPVTESTRPRTLELSLSDTAASSYATAATIPTGSGLAIAIVSGMKSAGAWVAPTTPTGWTHVLTDTHASNTSRGLSVYKRTTESSSGVTFSFAAGLARAEWAVYSFHNAGDIVQTTPGDLGANGTSLSFTMTNALASGSMVFGYVRYDTLGAAAITPGANFTELDEGATASHGNQAQYDPPTASTTVDWSTASSLPLGGVGIEVGVMATAAPAGLASGTGSAGAPAASIKPNASEATGTGAAPTATANVKPNAGAASGTGAALQPTVLIPASTNAPAGLVAGAGSAGAPSVTIAPNAGQAAGTGQALDPGASVKANAGAAQGTGTAHQPTVSTIAGTSAAAGTASGSGDALGPSVTIAPNAGLGSGSGSANDPTVISAPTTSAPAGLATGIGTAHQPTVVAVPNVSASAGLASGTGSAGAPSVSIRANAGLATGIGAAHQPTVTTLTEPIGGLGHATLTDSVPEAALVAEPEGASTLTDAIPTATLLDEPAEAATLVDAGAPESEV